MDVRDGCKQTDVGQIPADWCVKSIGEISLPVRGGSPRPAGDPRYFNGSYIPWVTVAALTNIPTSQLTVKETSTYLTEDGSHRSRILSKGTLIIANSGATLGVAKILGMKCCANDGIAALLNLQSKISPVFLAHYLNTKTLYLRNVVATGNGQPNLNTGLIRNLKFPLPPTRLEQEAIAEALSDADALIECLEQLIAKKRLVKQGAIQEMLSPKDEWLKTKLGSLGVFIKGSGVTKDKSMSGELNCVRYGEIYTRHNDYITQFYSKISKDVAANAQPLKCGDLLFAGSGETKEEIGKCVALVAEVEAYAGGDVIILRPNSVNSLFMGYYLNTPPIQRQKAARGQGDAVVHISASSLADIDIRLPPYERQAFIATELSDMDAEIVALEIKLDKARQIKQGMMQNLLTGKIRLI